MAVWKTALLHQFPDGNPLNVHGVPGTLDVVPPVPVLPTPADDADRGFAIHPGQSLVYRFDRAFADVIGVDVRIDLRFPLQPGAQDFPLLTIGNGDVVVSMGHLEFIDPGFTPLTGRCRLGLRVGGALLDFDQLVVFHRQTTHFHVRWHTHGQAQLSHDGVLRAYQPSFAAGRTFGFDRLTIGGPVGGPLATAPHFLARRVQVKVLRRDDAFNELDGHTPCDPAYPPPKRCAETVRALHAALATRARGFMAETVAQLTQPWREGQPGGPFSPEAVRAHSAAVAAGRAFGEFLAQRDAGAADQVLAHVGTFFDVLAAANPAGYRQLVDDLTNRAESLDPTCRDGLAQAFAAQAGALEPLRQLLEATSARARAAGAGAPHA